MINSNEKNRLPLIIFIVGGMVLLVAIFAFLFINNNVENNINNDKNNVNSSENQDDELDEDEIKDDTKRTFWFNTIDWNQPRPKEITYMYNEKVTLPIDLENIDPTKIKQGNALENDESTISPDNILNIIIENYFEDDSTTKDCYSNGWWYIISGYNLEKVFNTSLGEGYRNNFYELPLILEIINKIGLPSYVLMSQDDIEEVNSNFNKGILSYDFVYDYNEYVIQFNIMEMITDNNAYSVTIGGIRYYTKQSWEKTMHTESYFSTMEIIKKQ